MSLIWGIGRKVKAKSWSSATASSAWQEAEPTGGLGVVRIRPCRYCGLVRGRWDSDSDKDCPTYGQRVRRRVLIAGVCVLAVILAVGLATLAWAIKRTGAEESPIQEIQKGVEV